MTEALHIYTIKEEKGERKKGLKRPTCRRKKAPSLITKRYMIAKRETIFKKNKKNKTLTTVLLAHNQIVAIVSEVRQTCMFTSPGHTQPLPKHQKSTGTGNNNKNSLKNKNLTPSPSMSPMSAFWSRRLARLQSTGRVARADKHRIKPFLRQLFAHKTTSQVTPRPQPPQA